MEPLRRREPSDALEGRSLSVELARWMTDAEVRLRVGGEWSLAAALREGLELAGEELRVEAEALRDGAHRADDRLARRASLAELAPVGLLVTSDDGRICEANAEAARLVQLPEHQLVGRTITRFVALGDRRFFRGVLGGLVRTAGVRSFPLRLRTAHGGIREAQVGVRAHGRADERPALFWALHELGGTIGDDLL